MDKFSTENSNIWKEETITKDQELTECVKRLVYYDGK